MIERALLSVYDKRGLAAFAHGLADLGVELVASGGTSAFLSEHGLPVTRVDELTDVPELLDGRAKTLHPAIHAAILARRDVESDVAVLEEKAIRPFDLVCVNLYPFRRAVAENGPEEHAIELIDVGGPALLRGAAKNFAHVLPVCSVDRYEPLLRELRESGDVSGATRRELAAEAFAHTAAYDAAIAQWFSRDEAFPERLVLSLEKERQLPYGENPHQRAALYVEAGRRGDVLSRIDQRSGPELSFNNLNDLDAARALVGEFPLPACAIVKHGNPCGCALASGLDEAYAQALACDPVSAYGGVLALNRRVEASLADEIAARFVEVVIAPGYSDEALAILEQKQRMRVVEDRERPGSAPERAYRHILGGVLVQDADAVVDDRAGMRVVTTRAPSEPTWGDLLFAWRVAKHVASNAIVLVKELRTIGIGGGQTSRVDAVRIALAKARELGHDPRGSALASDAFFPFPDGARLALEAGVAALIQPGGSKRDSDVIDAVEEARAAMVFTSRRHFRH
ncbi:MAG: bifunctional phosphoribosylaminoimidazolecarboxamide formyltransferase/IMP cyclohydrolase [Actinomycetota bacterium]|nr:bifunctional phosphoribosylaminoimidazolecarboxamide formyltransferase/IMP cyclohydrolase [Actinomycetota bacterium]